jgi:hypothetical protein
MCEVRRTGMDWLSVLIGAAITLAVSSVFYVLAARDLKHEANALRERTVELEAAIERSIASSQ